MEKLAKQRMAVGEQSLEGACHCGAVRFRVELDLSKPVSRCNCSICTKSNLMGAIVRPNAFELLSGADALATYEWGGRTARRHFCKHCGVNCFARGYLAEVGGDYVSINCQTLENVEFGELSVIYWDGRHDNWEAGPRPQPWPIFREAASA